MAADALGTPAPAATPTVGVVSDEDHRLAMAGIVSPQTSTLAVRTGVMWGPGSTAVVSGTAATGTMTYSIAIHHAVTTRGTADGVYLGPTLDAATTVTTTAAPGSNSRIDIIWAKQNDTSSTISVDSGSTAPLYGVANGTAAVSPVAPSIPVGAVELGRATVAAGATSTNGAGVTISQTATQVVARGVDVPVRTQAERDALTTFPMLGVKRLDTGSIEVRNAGNTAWQTVRYTSTTDSAWTNYTGISGISVTASWTVVNLFFARKDGQLFVNGNTGRPSWLNGETILTLPAGWRPQQGTEWLARMNSTYYLMVLETGGALRIFVDNSAGTIQGSGTGVDDTFAVIGTPTLLA